MFFESHHSIDEQEFHVGSGNNMFSLPHLHLSFEFFMVTKGQTKVTIDGKEYQLKPNQAVLIFPYQVHSYQSQQNSAFFLCIFSPWLVPHFYQKTKQSLPDSNRFDYHPQKYPPEENIFLQKAFAYNICGKFDQQANYMSAAEGQKDELLTQLLLFITQHYKSDCLLKTAAKYVQYDYVYVSKFFKRAVGLSFHSYVNQFRIQEACRLIKATNQPISLVAEECGFPSLRTFYRDFKRFTGFTPKEYKKQL